MQLGKFLCNFINFLRKFDTGGSVIDPVFKCNGLNMCIIRVGSLGTMEYGYEPYISYITSAAKGGIKVFYLLARGRASCWIADELALRVCKEHILEKTDEYIEEVTYKGRTVKTSCIRLENVRSPYNPLEEYFQSRY